MSVHLTTQEEPGIRPLFGRTARWAGGTLWRFEPRAIHRSLIVLMLDIDHILCLAAPGSVAPVVGYAWPLAEQLGATLHLMPLADKPSDPAHSRGLDQAVAPFRAKAGETSILVADSSSTPTRSFDAALREYVSERDVDLIVARSAHGDGSRESRTDPRIQSLIRQFDRPVLFAGPGADVAAFRRIRVPTNLSAPSRTALEHAVGFASMENGTIDVLHVVDTSPYVALTPTDELSLSSMPLAERRARRELHDFLGTVQTGDTPIQPRIAFGDPVERFVRVSSQEDIDLLVLPDSGTSSHALDQVFQRVQCSLLVVRPSGHLLVGNRAGSTAAASPNSNA